MVKTNTFNISFYVLDGSGNQVDLATPDTLESMSFSEFSGGMIPVGTIIFLFKDKSYIRPLNEKNLCILNIELTGNNYSVSYRCRIVSSQIEQKGKNLFRVITTVCGDYVGFFNTRKTRFFNSSMSIDAIQAVLESNGMSLSTDIVSSNDVQNWIQPNCPDSVFIANTLYSMNLDGKNPFYALLFSNEVLILSSKYIHDVEPISCGDGVGALSYIEVSDMIQDTMKVNRFAGYGLSAIEFDLNNEEVNELEELPNTEAFITSDKAHVADPTVSSKYVGSFFKTDNHHENFYKAKLFNKVNSSVVTTFRLKVVVKDIPQIKIFTKLRLFIPDINNPKDLNYQLSGDYIVLSKTVKVSGQDMFVELILGRQSINYK